MTVKILKNVLEVLCGVFVGTVAVSVWFTLTSDNALLTLIAAVGSLIGILGVLVCAPAWLAVVNSEN